MKINALNTVSVGSRCLWFLWC